MTKTAIDILEQKILERLERIRWAEDCSDGGGRMYGPGELKKEKRKRRDAERTLELIRIARAEAKEVEERAPSGTPQQEQRG